MRSACSFLPGVPGAAGRDGGEARGASAAGFREGLQDLTVVGITGGTLAILQLGSELYKLSLRPASQELAYQRVPAPPPPPPPARARVLAGRGTASCSSIVD